MTRLQSDVNVKEPTAVGSSLDGSLTKVVLTRLGLDSPEPNLDTLDALIDGFTNTVPWESASRIVRHRQRTAEVECPRWPVEFWQQHLALGTGGTCFESNYAVFYLLRTLGYEGYLTINDMGETKGCHTAIVVQLDGVKWLVDAGYPLHAPLRIDENSVTHRNAPFHQYAVRPDNRGRYLIERTAHPEPIVFTLIDTPIPEIDYRTATAADYSENGLFLDQLIMNKVIDGVFWRFTTGERPLRLNAFSDGVRVDHEFNGKVASELARHFNMDFEVIQTAMRLIMDQT